MQTIPGLWADIDYGNKAHQKANLPPDEVAAWKLIEALPLRLTLVVHSGHGLQVWWLFNEPWTFETADERQQAITFCKRFEVLLKRTAGQYDWMIDSTCDLARVFRLPGTLNHKHDPVSVRLVEYNANSRYDPSEIEPYLPTDSPASFNNHRRETIDDLTEEPAEDKFSSLLTNDADFRHAFFHEGRRRSSLSEYDMSIANMAAAAGWSNGEIVWVINKHRRHHGDGPKHKGYYEITIGKARNQVGRAEVDREIDAKAAEIEQTGSEPDRQELLHLASRRCGVQIDGLVEITGASPVYRLETAAGSIQLGSAAAFVEQARFRRKVIEVAGVMPRKMTEEQWHQFVNWLLAAREQQSGGAENTEVGIVRDWISSYLYHCRTPVEWDKVETAARERCPFRSRDGDLCIYSNTLREFVTERASERVNREQLAGLLRHAGCISKTIHYDRSDGTRTTTAVWIVPDSLYKER